MIKWSREVQETLNSHNIRICSDLQSILSRQPSLTEKQLRDCSDWILALCEDAFPQNQIIAEDAWKLILSFLSENRVSSIKALELVSWACICLAAERQHLSITPENVCAHLGTCDPQKFLKIKTFVTQKVQTALKISPTSEIADKICSDHEVKQLTQKFVKKGMEKLRLCEVTVAEAAVAGLIWAFGQKGYVQAKEELCLLVGETNISPKWHQFIIKIEEN